LQLLPRGKAETVEKIENVLPLGGRETGEVGEKKEKLQRQICKPNPT